MLTSNEITYAPSRFNLKRFASTHVRDGLRMVPKTDKNAHLSRIRWDYYDYASSGELHEPKLSGLWIKSFFGTISDARYTLRVSEHWYDSEIAAALWKAGLTSIDGSLFHWPDQIVMARTAMMAQDARDKVRRAR